ncbi:MAG TPA: hypothetical protein VJQ59_17245 [Candidatus Sulfotelmatobacter sp.]|nr:hypothetical protein [Candidatus Sulfotelmatobacter sp.]
MTARESMAGFTNPKQQSATENANWSLETSKERNGTPYSKPGTHLPPCIRV